MIGRKKLCPRGQEASHNRSRMKTTRGILTHIINSIIGSNETAAKQLANLVYQFGESFSYILSKTKQKPSLQNTCQLFGTRLRQLFLSVGTFFLRGCGTI